MTQTSPGGPINIQVPTHQQQYMLTGGQHFQTFSSISGPNVREDQIPHSSSADTNYQTFLGQQEQHDHSDNLNITDCENCLRNI